ncbi:MAG: S8 family serine peptidase [Saprospiraceae bacterium]
MLSITLLLLCLWIFGKHNAFFSGLIRVFFFISLGLFVLSSFYNSVSFADTILLLSISCLTMALTGFILDLVSHNKIVQIIVSIISVMSGMYIEKSFRLPDYQIVNTTSYDPDGEILVEIDQNRISEISKIITSKNKTIRSAFKPLSGEITELDDYYVIDVDKNDDVNQFMNDFKNMDGIKWIEPNEIIPFDFPQRTEIESMDKYGKLSNDPSVNMQWHLSFLNMEQYYKFFISNNIQPQRAATLYILDTGIDGSHEDLPSDLTKNKDKQGHGTHCAGVAAAITNNNIGVASMTPNKDWVKVKGIQVIGDIGFGTQKSIIDGIIEATDNGADVISLSLGGITNQERQKAYNDAVKYANDKGAIVVVAAGNANLDGKRYSPANAENVITVTSVNEKSEKSGFSNHVENLKMGIAAPGEKILSTTPSNTYTAFSGTSMATPQVAGLIAVMKAINPKLNTQTVYRILNSTGKETQNTLRTGKLIQPLDAIKALF